MENDREIENILEMFCGLMEKNIFLYKSMCPKTISLLCNCSQIILDRVLLEQLGFSTKQTIALYRVQYARELLSIGVNYNIVYKYSGFNSRKELEKALGCIVN